MRDKPLMGWSETVVPNFVVLEQTYKYWIFIGSRVSFYTYDYVILVKSIVSSKWEKTNSFMILHDIVIVISWFIIFYRFANLNKNLGRGNSAEAHTT